MFRGRAGRYRDWSRIVEKLRSNPERWCVRLSNEPVRLVRTVRDRSAPELRLDDGVIEAVALNVYRDSKGTRRGDVYLRFTPSK